MRRRDALRLGLSVGAGAAAAAMTGIRALVPGRDDAHLRIIDLQVELARGVVVPAIGFSGHTTGSSFEVCNDTATDKLLHSTLFADSLVTVTARRRAHVPWRAPAASTLQLGPKYYSAYCPMSKATALGAVDPASDAGAYDQRHVMPIHRWLPRPLVRTGPFNDTVTTYRYASFNDKLRSASEPIKVRRGERVQFHFANVGSTLPVTLALPQHRFLIVALDGNAVPTRREVQRLFIGPGESVDAVVTMNQPGVWVLGSTCRDDRLAGLGRVIEYAGVGGPPVESDFAVADWDYAYFGAPAASTRRAPAAARLLSLQPLPRLYAQDPRLSDPTPQPTVESLEVTPGERYRVAMTNFTRDVHSLQLLDHELELVNVAGRPTAGVVKDVVTLASYTRLECEFIARSAEVVIAHPKQVVLEAVLRA